jgi:aminopeptidase S
MPGTSDDRRWHRTATAVAYLPFVAAAAIFLLTGQAPIPREAIETPLRFDATRAMHDLERLDAITRTHGGRVSGSAGNRATADDLVVALKALPGLSVSEPAVAGDRFPLRNIVATRAGQSTSELLLGAHYDSPYPGPGMVDNAAGVAILLELARQFAGSSPRCRLRFVFFDSEERDTAGSAGYLGSLTPAERSRLRAVISLDALGWRDGSPVVHTMLYRDAAGLPHIAPDWLVGTLLRTARARDLPLALGDTRLPLVHQLLARGARTGFHSDDRPFMLAGVPAVYLASFSFTNFYPHYHAPTDTLDRISREQIETTGRIAEAGVLALDALDPPPRSHPHYLFLGARRLTSSDMIVLALLAGLPIWTLVGRRGPSPGVTFRIGAAVVGAGFAVGAVTEMRELVLSLLVLPVLFLPVVALRSGRWVQIVGLVILVPAAGAAALALIVGATRPWLMAMPARNVALLVVLVAADIVALRAGANGRD